jgi:Anti-sigma-K factor rskA
VRHDRQGGGEYTKILRASVPGPGRTQEVTLPPLLDVPPSLVAPSVRAAVADPDSPAPIRRAPRRSPGWSRRWSLAGIVGIAAAAVAVTITITSQSGGHGEFQRIATLTGAGNASGYVAVGRPNGAAEPVVVSISHLDPVPGDQYYEIWFQTGGQHVPGVAFNAGSNGSAEVRLTAPVNTKWVRCWITRESIADPSTSTVVMRATPTQRST